MVRSTHKAEQYYAPKEICTSSWTMPWRAGARGAVYAEGKIVLHWKRDIIDIFMNNVMTGRCLWCTRLNSITLEKRSVRLQKRDLYVFNFMSDRCLWYSLLTRLNSITLEKRSIRLWWTMPCRTGVRGAFYLPQEVYSSPIADGMGGNWRQVYLRIVLAVPEGRVCHKSPTPLFNKRWYLLLQYF